jgi:hypothetical protein
MRMTFMIIMALLFFMSCDFYTHDALADGLFVNRHIQKVRHNSHSNCWPGRCGRPAPCPSGTCYSLYGAYLPYGGSAYWGRYTSRWWGSQ